MRRILPLCLLAISLTAVAQVTITPNGQATTSGPAVPAAPAQPQVVPANVALPGSGPATGLPPDMTVNDSRTGGTVSVYQPRADISTTSNAAVAAGAAPAAPATSANENNADNTGSVVAATNSNLATTNAAQPVRLGIQNYAGSQPTTAVAAPPVSLGDVARMNKSQKPRAVRTFTNESIGAPPAQPSNNEQPKSKKISSANDAVLDRNDLAQVEAALHRHDTNQAVENQNSEIASAGPANPAAEYARLTSEAEKQSPANAGAQSSAANQAAANQPVKQGRGGTNDQLPSSSSPLPLLALLGFAAFTGGVAYRYGQR